MSESAEILRQAALLARLGRLDEAERLLADVARPDSRLLRSHGQILAALGRWPDALGKFDAAVARDPADLASWRGLGTIYAMLHDVDRAVDAFDRILAAAPDDADTLRSKADALIGAGRAAAAEPLLRRLAFGGDKIAIIRHFLCLSVQGRAEEAEALYGADPDQGVPNPDLCLSAAREALSLGAPREAERWYRRAAALAPENTEALTGLGTVTAALGRRKEAIALLRRAVASDPQAVYARELLATALHDDGQADEVGREIEALFALDPRNAQAHALSAYRALLAVGRTASPDGDARKRILDHLSAARAGRPDDPGLILPVAELFNRLGAAGEAASTLKALRRARPDNLAALFAAARATINVCDWEDYDALRARVFDNVDTAIAAGALDDEALRLLAALGGDYAQAMRVARHLAKKNDHGARMRLGPRGERGRLRIGYIQAQTRFHSTMAVARGLIEGRDRSAFEVYGYARHDRSDGAREAFQDGYRAAFDVFRDLSALDDREAALRIAADDIDILIDLIGPGTENQMGVLAFRPARVIVHYYGHAYGTGADYVDYLLVDPVYMPPHLVALGSEAPVYLPPCFMAAMPGRASTKALTRAAVGLPDDAVVFANFNHPWKFEPRGFGAWMTILRAVPRSVLWIANWHDAAMGHLRAAVAAAGIETERLIVAPTAAHDDHLARLALADLALDPFYVAGGVTTFDALRAGLPVIAHGGAADTPSARMGASIVGAAGLTDLVASEDERYLELAVALGRDRERRRTLRAGLPMRAARALDIAASARTIESAYHAIWSRHVAGLAPARIDLPVTGA